MSDFTIVLHGGAGTILKEDMTPALEQAYCDGLQQALDLGYAVLEQGGTAVNAVKAALVILEDNVLFNAGRGAVFTKKGVQEMDAAIMDGSDLSAGAVAGVRNVRNPIELATEVMRNSNHVFLSGKGANDFAIKQGVKLEPDEYFFSQFRYDQWKAIRDSDTYSLDHTNHHLEELMRDKKFGTVGAVACDSKGNLAAATSTGGMTNKKYGRIGDSPVIPLERPTEEIRNHYRSDLKENIRKAEKLSLVYGHGSVQEAVTHYREQYGSRMQQVQAADYQRFQLLGESLQQKEQCLVRSVRDQEGELLAIALLLKDNRRIYNLMNTTLPGGRNKEANHWLIDRIIQEFSGQPLLLDMEGSELPGVKNFYESFGAVAQPYFHYHDNRLPWPLRLLKR